MSSIFVSILAFLAAVLFHSIGARLLPRVNRVKLFATIGAAIALALACLFPGEDSDVALSAFLLYGFLCELYIFSFTLALGSISANILMLLDNGETSLAGIASKYSGASMTSLRLDRLCRSGYLRTSDESWMLTTRGRTIANRFARFRQFLGHA
jgi:hypothetical protein